MRQALAVLEGGDHALNRALDLAVTVLTGDPVEAPKNAPEVSGWGEALVDPLLLTLVFAFIVRSGSFADATGRAPVLSCASKRRARKASKRTPVALLRASKALAAFSTYQSGPSLRSSASPAVRALRLSRLLRWRPPMATRSVAENRGRRDA